MKATTIKKTLFHTMQLRRHTLGATRWIFSNFQRLRAYSTFHSDSKNETLLIATDSASAVINMKQKHKMLYKPSFSVLNSVNPSNLFMFRYRDPTVVSGNPITIKDNLYTKEMNEMAILAFT